jgi:hypothetical protein
MNWHDDHTQDIDLNTLAASVRLGELDGPLAPGDLVVYEATYKEPYESPIHIGLFRTEDAARLACVDYFAQMASFRSPECLRVELRLLSA